MKTNEQEYGFTQPAKKKKLFVFCITNHELHRQTEKINKNYKNVLMI